MGTGEDPVLKIEIFAETSAGEIEVFSGVGEIGGITPSGKGISEDEIGIGVGAVEIPRVGVWREDGRQLPDRMVEGSDLINPTKKENSEFLKNFRT